MQYILRWSQIYFGFSPQDIKTLAYEYARKIGVEYPVSWNEHECAGREWFTFFMNRHKQLSVRVPECISLARPTAFNKENVQLFFQQYGPDFDKIGNDPLRVWNMDEMGFTTVSRGDAKCMGNHIFLSHLQHFFVFF